MRVLVFGDSITYGAWDCEGGWVDRLKRDAHKQTVRSQGKNKLQIINLGIGGNSSSTILSRMESEINARYSKGWPFAFVFTFGANDERAFDGVVQTPTEQFSINCQQIIDIAKKHASKIMFIGAPPIGKERVILKDAEYSDLRIREYDRVLKEIVESNELPFVSLREVFEKKPADALFVYDSIHPNDQGHKLIYEIVKPKLLELLR